MQVINQNKVIRRHAECPVRIPHTYHIPFRDPTARNPAKPPGVARFFSTTRGTEAAEVALNLTRLCARTASDAPDKPAAKHRILAMQNSFHGRTFGAVSVTSTEKYRLPFAPLVPGVEFVHFNDIADHQRRKRQTVFLDRKTTRLNSRHQT